MKAPEPQKDPELEAERERARMEKRQAIGEKLGTQTQQLARLYGARRSLAGGSSRPGIMAGL